MLKGVIRLHKGLRWFLALFLCIALAFPIGYVHASSPQPSVKVPEPKFMGVVNPEGMANISQLPPPSNDTTPGAWFVGATPPNADPNKPPIVFVQGMNGRAQSWWSDTTYHGINDMYEKAYLAGYRTAFVQLYDAAGNGSETPWNNGRLLASQLQAIYNHFGQKVNIVAHSKGGPDTQAALVHYGAHVYVGRVVTLGSPHHGSHLANLAYSWWAGWLADLLGQKSPGVYSLQTGEMAKFREQTDNHANNRKNSFFTAAGTDWGPFLSALQAGGLYLSQWGSNDGLVNVWSTKLPFAQHIFTIDVDHDAIRKGSVVFDRIEPYLRSTSVVPLSQMQAVSSMNEMEDEKAETQHDMFVHGGPLNAGEAVEQNVWVQPGSTKGVFNILTKSEQVNVTLVSPSGKVYNSSSAEYNKTEDKSFFVGATLQSFHVNKPETGVWKVKIQRSYKDSLDDAYFLYTVFEGDQTVQTDLPSKAKQKEVPFALKFKEKNRLNISSMKVDVKVVDPDGKKVSTAALQRKAGSNDFSGKVKGTKKGTYNVTIEIQGRTKDGQPFARSIVKSVYID